MAETESELRQQEMERDSLQRTVSGLQGALMFSTAEGRPILELALRNASGRLAVVEKKVKDLTTKKETEAKAAMTQAAVTAAQETRLNEQEKGTFAGFLKESFFTKTDFGRLEEFYAKTWDRLSEHGKDEMSHRIWEGVRRDEYRFSELPKTVREKEAKQAYNLIRNSAGMSSDVSRIPEKDREDFIRAYEAGKNDEAVKALDRDGFKQNLFRGKESASRTHAGVDRGSSGKRAAALANLEAPEQKDSAKVPAKSPTGTDRDLSAALEGVKLADVQTQGTSAEIPNAKSGGVQRQSARGC